MRVNINTLQIVLAISKLFNCENRSLPRLYPCHIPFNIYMDFVFGKIVDQSYCSASFGNTSHEPYFH